MPHLVIVRRGQAGAYETLKTEFEHAVSLDGASVIVKTIGADLRTWLRRIDRWIAYANSVVEEGPGSPGPVDSSGREERC